MNAQGLKNRLARSGALLFAVLHLAVAATILYSTWHPGYRGGMFLQALLVGVAGLSSIAIVSELLGLMRSRPASEPGGIDPAFLIAIWIVVILLTVTVAGIYLGSTLLLFAYWLVVVRMSPLRALGFALLFGLLMPLLFSHAMDRRLWPGILPTIIPQYLGGGVIPPL